MDEKVETGLVHIVDDDRAVRESLAVFIESAGMPVRTHDSAESLISRLDSHSAMCIIADIRMPGIDGLQLQQMISDYAPSVPVILITGHGNIPMAVKALKAGAADFFEKPFNPRELLARIKELSSQRDRAPNAGAPINTVIAARRLTQLTMREREVLDLLIRGYPNKEVGRELGISPRTVEVHRRRIMEKMQAESFSHLVRMAVTVQERGT